VPTSLVWRYRRNEQVLYVHTEHTATWADYLLTYRYPNGKCRTMRLSSLAQVYDALHKLETELGAQGWELLPTDRRAPDRLRPPTCETCWAKPVEVPTRTTTHVTFACTGCARTWVVAKPGSPRDLGTSACRNSR
jgi:hypothetical protein